MRNFTDYASHALGLRIPQDYAGFMETHGKKLSDDPVHKASWIGGLGTADFVIGTTLAFRSSMSNLPKDFLVIGYIGSKTIIVNKTYEEIDEYLVLNARDGSLLSIDSMGATQKIAAGFAEWITPDLLRASLREKYSSNLTVVVFDQEPMAEEARQKLIGLQREGYIELEDAVVVSKDPNGTAHYRQTHRPARKGGLAGSITGLIVGSIFFAPMLGAAFGAAAGAVSAALTDTGIDDRFIQELSQKFGPGCSALFTLVRKADLDKVAEAFLGFGGKVLVNSVSREREAAMQKLLDTTKTDA
ncbi:DUF1269 domain-containing protein [Desulfoferrobacter suflitae]|uniref:DUF1269 domain-containing protein n=1 Tax=Desulfoferrobacter suflitae TaxID=2865782 RepID=UPI0021644F3A|nr:DUF1269 domain-containing protein [Desulfoferrobacter suflitae]MCK8602932.1 DUF1269 domain-containing protein [Desulfoferrobacter suflitae]